MLVSRNWEGQDLAWLIAPPFDFSPRLHFVRAFCSTTEDLHCPSAVGWAVAKSLPRLLGPRELASAILKELSIICSANLAEVIPLSPLERTFFSLHLGHLYEMKLLLHVNNRVADINLLTTEHELTKHCVTTFKFLTITIFGRMQLCVYSIIRLIL